MKRDTWIAAGVTAIVAAAFTFMASRDYVSANSALPQTPALYAGTATVDGAPVPDGFLVYAKIRDYLSEPIPVKKGFYNGLMVSPPDSSYVGLMITFLLGDEPANETDEYRPRGTPTMKFDFPLTFSRLPDPTPVPTPVIPTATATAEPAQPSVYAGFLTVSGAELPAQASLVAKIESYESDPALISGGEYKSLVVAPGDINFVGRTIEFFLNGTLANKTAIYRGGEFVRDLDLVFFGLPTPTPTAVPPTAVPPTATPTRTPTVVPPTASPTATTVPPTATPTRTPTASPTATATLTATPAQSNSTATEVPTRPTVAAQLTPKASPTPEPSSGGCFSPHGHVIPGAGLGNTVLLVAPLALVAGLRSRRKLGL